MSANLNKVMLIGRLTRDPETRTFSNGGKIATFGFAVNNRKKNQASGQWEEDPVFIDVKASNRESGRKLADLVEQYLKKGHLAYIEGSLTLDQWDDKDTGQKRSKIKLLLHDLQFLEPRADGGNARTEGGNEGGARSAPARGMNAVPPRKQETTHSSSSEYDDEPPEPQGRGNGNPPEDDIPF